jgi:hypothetical protein
VPDKDGFLPQFFTLDNVPQDPLSPNAYLPRFGYVKHGHSRDGSSEYLLPKDNGTQLVYEAQFLSWTRDMRVWMSRWRTSRIRLNPSGMSITHHDYLAD